MHSQTHGPGTSRRVTLPHHPAGGKRGSGHTELEHLKALIKLGNLDEEQKAAYLVEIGLEVEGAGDVGSADDLDDF